MDRVLLKHVHLDAEYEGRTSSTPISSLKNPNLFPPPPKHREFHPDAGSATVSPEYNYLYQPAYEQQQKLRQQQQQQYHPNNVYQPGQPGVAQQPPVSNGVPSYQPSVPAQPGSQPPVIYQQPSNGYQPQPQAPAPPYQSATPYAPQQQYAQPTPPPSLPQRSPPPLLPPRGTVSPAYGQAPLSQAAYSPQPAQAPVAGYQPPYSQSIPQPQVQPQYGSQPIQSPQPIYSPAYQAPQQQAISQISTPTSTSEAGKPFVKGHGYSQSVIPGADSASPQSQIPVGFPPQQANFAAEIAKARNPTTSGNGGGITGQRVPSGHRPTQSMSAVGKKPPPPPPKPKNPALRGSPTSPVPNQSFSSSNGYDNSRKPPQIATKQQDGRPLTQPAGNLNKIVSVSGAPPGRNPPPIIASSKPVPTLQAIPTPVATPPTPAQWAPPQIDLELEKKWYNNGASSTQISQWPAFLTGLTFQSSISIQGSQKTVILAVRFSDLSRSKFRIESDLQNPSVAATAQRIDFPPPLTPNDDDLNAASSAFGENVAKFAEANYGRQVGDGECWSLANEALANAGALKSVGLIHGVSIWEVNSGRVIRGQKNVLRRGDVLQFKSAKFREINLAGVAEVKTVGAPDHTSVIVAIEGVGAQELQIGLVVLEQNVNHVRTVQQGRLDFQYLQEGSVIAYRPFWNEWAGVLDTTWP
ncbi:hypothetical protein V1514DRAFT_333196 [Lipomyces japonicus]|uniref:uncharacterized protein n=1 Tax=Lipomyces japonicus TaxID=56871 RepID=UPI0034CE41D1